MRLFSRKQEQTGKLDNASFSVRRAGADVDISMPGSTARLASDVMQQRYSQPPIPVHSFTPVPPYPSINPHPGALTVQKKARKVETTGTTSPTPEQVLGQLGAGQPLHPAVAEWATTSLGHDVSGIKVHTNSRVVDEMDAEGLAIGTHVAFAPGKYRPGTRAGDRLVAHELAHVVQQTGGSGQLQAGAANGDAYEIEADRAADAMLAGEPVSDLSSLDQQAVQRWPSGGEQVCRGPEFGPGADEPVCEMPESLESRGQPGIDPSPSAGMALHEQGALGSIMASLSEDDRATVRKAIESRHVYELIEHRHALERRFNRAGRRGMGIIRYLPRNVQHMEELNRQIQEELSRLGLENEEAVYRLINQDVPRIVLQRAKQVALAMLERNENMVRAEMARYAQQVCSPDLEGLLMADAELGSRYEAIQSTRYDIQYATRHISSVPAGVPETAAGYGIPPQEESMLYVIRRIDEYRARLPNMISEFEHVKQEYGARYPVLLTRGYEPGSFSSAPREQLGQLTARPLQTILDNIAEVREDIRDDDMKVWNIHGAVSGAIADLGIRQNPFLMGPVLAEIRNRREDASFLMKLKIALSLTTTLLAGLLGGPLASGIVGGMWGVSFLHSSVREYMMESAAENVAMDPEVRDISVNEPELLWVVLDVIGLGLDVAAVLRALRPAARATLRSRRLVEFAETTRRVLPDAPEAAERLIRGMRQRLGREAMEETPEAVAAARSLGRASTVDDYLEALRREQHPAGSVGRSWDYRNHPRGVPASRWRPGDPIDMPNTRGTYPSYRTARQRYWRNRAHFELEARQRGETVRRPGVTTDPVAGLTDDELRRMETSGRAPQYAYPNRAGQTWELEHHGVPQRVGKWLRELGFNRPGEAERLIQASRPGSLMEVTPLEHAFFDVEAGRFGRLRADVTGARWTGTAAADIRGNRPLYYMSDETIREIMQRAEAANMDFSRTRRTRLLRDALRQEIRERGLQIQGP